MFDTSTFSRSIVLISGIIVSTLVGCDTEYASGYTESAFKEIEVGDSLADVESALGPPVEIWPPQTNFIWTYTDAGIEFISQLPDEEYASNSQSIHSLSGNKEFLRDEGWEQKKPSLGEVVSHLGEPDRVVKTDRIERWEYTISPSSTHYRLRAIFVDRETEKVIWKNSELYID